MKDYYRILQITPDASQDEIKKAYRRLAKVHHPDVTRESGGAVFIQEINEAYKTLSHPDKRSHYDWIRTNHSTLVVEEAPPSRPSSRRYSYRGFRMKPLSEREIVQPYLKYAYAISYLALLFSLLLSLDFFLPMRQRTDKATYVIRTFSEQGGDRQSGRAQIQTWSGRIVTVSEEAGNYFEQYPDLLLYSTPILGKARYVAPVNKQENSFWIGRSIYGNFIFFPLILLICAVLGSLKRFSPEVDFSFGVASGILLLISAGLLLV